MTKEEYKLKMLSEALQDLNNTCDKLICIPELKKKADALREEIQKEYENIYNNSSKC